MEHTHFKTIPHNGVEYDVSILDTAGQDEYSYLNPKHATGIHGYILVYSVTNRESYDTVRIVYEKLRQFKVRATLLDLAFRPWTVSSACWLLSWC